MTTRNDQSEITSLVWTPSPEDLSVEADWITTEAEKLGSDAIKNLAQQAKEARETSYSPYSSYKVGAALLSTSGEIYQGCNIEIASYSEAGHAEEDAAKLAVMKGEVKKSGRRFIRAIAISHISDSAPCGRCRQILAEFCDNCLIIVADEQGDLRKITSLKTLFPYAFTPTDLGQK